MSEKDKLLNQNKEGEMIWYTHRWKEVVSRCEVFGFSKEEIIEKYGSVEEFEKVETEHNESVIGTYTLNDWMGEGVECKYELNFDSGWGDRCFTGRQRCGRHHWFLQLLFFFLDSNL